MKLDEFDRIVKKRLEKILSTLASKGHEYARSDDRLGNIKHDAAIAKLGCAVTCVSKASKHVSSIVDLAHEFDAGKHSPIAMWEEKIGDAINYLIILEALVKERRE